MGALRLLCALLATLLITESRAHPGDAAGYALPATHRRQLLAAYPACGMLPASNDGRSWNVPQLGPMTADSGPDLLRADAAPDTTHIYLDRWDRGGGVLSLSKVVVSSNTLLTKPLVASSTMQIEVAPGATLTLAAQPVLPLKQVFYGTGAVRFQSGNASQVFSVAPEWFGGITPSFSDTLDKIGAACQAAKCLVALTKSYGLARPWRLSPHVLPWSGMNAELHPEKGNKQGIVFSSGAYDPTKRVDLPRLQMFDTAITLQDVSGLWTYAGNIKYVKSAVTLAPLNAISNVQVEAYSVVSSSNVFTVQPAARRRTAGALPLLQNVYLRNYMLVKTAPGVSNINWFRGCVALSNMTIENSEVNGNEPKSSNVLLKSDCPSGISNLNFRVTTMNFAHPKPWTIAAGNFIGLRSYVRLGQPITQSGGTVAWGGANNTLFWGGMDATAKDAVKMTESPRPGTAPLVGNSNVLLLPAFSGSWANNAVRTFYAYHVMMGGSAGGGTMQLGPHNHMRLPSSLRRQNPGIVVDGVEDQGSSSKFQLAIRLRNVSGRVLTAADVAGPVPLQFRLQVGVANMAVEGVKR